MSVYGAGFYGSGTYADPTLILQDSFTDVAGTLLASHTPEFGGPWVKHASYSGVTDIRANRLRSNPAPDCHYASPALLSPDVYVEGSFVALTAASGFSGVAARIQTATNGMYVWSWNASLGAFRLDRVSGTGTVTPLSTYTTSPATVNESHTLRIVVDGNQITGLLDNVERASVVDSTWTTGQTGTRTQSGSAISGGVHMESIDAHYIYDDVDLISPVVTVDSVSDSRVSRVAGQDASNVVFSADEAFVEYQVRVVPSTGSTINQGSLIEQAVVSSRTEHAVTLTDDELVAGGATEGGNIVKVFVKDAAGNWSI